MISPCIPASLHLTLHPWPRILYPYYRNLLPSLPPSYLSFLSQSSTSLLPSFSLHHHLSLTLSSSSNSTLLSHFRQLSLPRIFSQFAASLLIAPFIVTTLPSILSSSITNLTSSPLLHRHLLSTLSSLHHQPHFFPLSIPSSLLSFSISSLPQSRSLPISLLHSAGDENNIKSFRLAGEKKKNSGHFFGAGVAGKETPEPESLFSPPDNKLGRDEKYGKNTCG